MVKKIFIMTQSKWYIDKALKKIDDDLNDKLEKVGDLVSTAAKQNAPVKTGNLRNSISYSVNKVIKSVTIGTDVIYAVFQELGTKKILPTFFLTRALNENKDNINSILNVKIK